MDTKQSPAASKHPEPTDVLALDQLLSEEEITVRDETRAFVQEKISPNIKDWYEKAHFPQDIVPEMGKQGLLGMHLEGYGCAGRSATEYGLACMELEAGDTSLRTFVSVQGSLAMSGIHKFGSEEQKEEWLPSLASGAAIAAFGLTEPDAGSDPASMKTNARRDGSDWVLNGSKRWIGMGSIADVVLVWAQTDDGIRGFLVPTDTSGYTAVDIEHKLSLRASIQSELYFEDLRLPEEAVLPNVTGLKGPFTCLGEARYGIIWGVMGAARDCYETALEYSKGREQFGKAVSSFQLTQQKLVDMMLEIEKGLLVAWRIGKLKDEGNVRPEHISFGKLNNVREALDIAREARTILGGNGVTLEYPVMRHMSNLESVLTYEGTSEVHTLILGNALTGTPAFR
ncbi:MAG: acyl-CoA dehydrogenase family protein [Rubrobacteraceae bacterium]